MDDIVREGARRMLAAALEAEVTQYIAELADQRDEAGRRLVVRNGHHRERTVATAAGPVPVQVPVKAPRVNDKRVNAATGERERFSSQILAPWCRKSPKISEVLPLLYVHGLSSGDFVPAMEQFLGTRGPVSGLPASPLVEGGRHGCEGLVAGRGVRGRGPDTSAARRSLVSALGRPLAVEGGRPVSGDGVRCFLCGRGVRYLHPVLQLHGCQALQAQRAGLQPQRQAGGDVVTVGGPASLHGLHARLNPCARTCLATSVAGTPPTARYEQLHARIDRQRADAAKHRAAAADLRDESALCGRSSSTQRRSSSAARTR